MDRIPREGRQGVIYRGVTWAAEMAMRPFARGDLAERMVRDARPAPATIWVHGASVGELNSARTVIEDLARRADVIVTANSTTGRNLVRGWGLTARLAPLDTPQAVSRFLDAVRPAVMVTLENEIWPNRSRIAAARGIAQFVIGARMSERSAARWQRLRALIGPALSRMAGLSAQDGASEARFVQLGLPQAALMPRLQLKLLAPAATPEPANTADRFRCVLFASTHEGEDGPLIDMFLAARDRNPTAGLRLIVAPRHPARADQVAALMAERGLSPQRRSSGADADAPVLLADTLGEMDKWYAAAGICVTGGSVVDRGGHTPWEPAAHGCAILHGEHVANFAEDYAALDAADAACRLDAEGLTLAMLLTDTKTAAEMGKRAREILMDRAGDARPLIARILQAAGLAQVGTSRDIP